MADDGSNKRRRTSQDIPSIGTLPDPLLVEVAKYLPKPSIALFAAAFSPALRTDAPSTWRPSAKADAIISATATLPPPVSDPWQVRDGNQWQSLDFGCIEKSLASRLTDDDVRMVLMCIDAPNQLKTLKLTGCVSITGAGLELLRGSTALELIDLSLVGQHEKPEIEPEPSIAEGRVLPIVHSIIATPRFSLRFVQLPHKWRAGRSEEIKRFLGDYNRCLVDRKLIICSNCADVCQTSNGDRSCVDCDEDCDDSYYGLQRYCCYTCTRYFCYDCNGRDGEEAVKLNSCESCRKDYCGECEISGCGKQNCSSEVCKLCMEKCTQCDALFCEECIDCNECEAFGCPNKICSSVECHKQVGMLRCGVCSMTYCYDCRYESCSDDWGSSRCEGCFHIVEKERLKRDMEEIRRENEELRRENADLRKRIEQTPGA